MLKYDNRLKRKRNDDEPNGMPIKKVCFNFISNIMAFYTAEMFLLLLEKKECCKYNQKCCYWP